MIYNKITLAFPEKEEKLFLKKYFFDSILQVRVSFVLVTFLFGIFGILDSIMFPEYARVFHIIRYLFVVPFLSLVFLLSFTKVFQKIWQVLLLISFIIGGFGISIMTMLVPENYTYYAGMMLIFSAGYFFIKLRFFLATIAGWATLIIYNIGAIYYAQTPVILLVNNNFFFVSANIIGMFAAYNIEYYARRNFFLNYELDNEKLRIEEININLEKTVEERTNELQRAKEDAEESEERLQSVFFVAPTGIGLVKERILYEVNPKICQMTGYSKEELISKNSLILYPSQEEFEYVGREKYLQIQEKGTGIVEAKWKKKDGSIIDVLLASTPFDRMDIKKGVTFTALDITERKRLENELNIAKEHAEESDRLKSAFLANMSHEIRTPMNGILGFAEILKEPDLTSDQQQEYLGIIEKSGTRMLNIINDIVDISKIEAGLVKLKISKSNINEQIEYIYTFFKPEVEANGMILSFNNSLPIQDSVIYTDREKTYAILTNLVKNAIKYSHKGAIEFGYFKKGDFLEFYVKDTGIGVPKDRQNAIFERFVQADIADLQARQGAGLGLSITKAYVEMLGGKIWVESEEGIGSTFYFTLPYNTGLESQAIQKDLPGINLENVISPEVLQLKVLIAEDDEASERLLGIEIRKLSKEILKVRTGIEAVVAFRDNPDIDLILMDIQMPGMDGYEATRQIRQINKDVVIIAQTAFGLSGDREKAIEAGCTDYISKPIKNVELQKLIEKYFKK